VTQYEGIDLISRVIVAIEAIAVMARSSQTFADLVCDGVLEESSHENLLSLLVMSYATAKLQAGYKVQVVKVVKAVEDALFTLAWRCPTTIAMGLLVSTQQRPCEKQGAGAKRRSHHVLPGCHRKHLQDSLITTAASAATSRPAGRIIKG